VISAGTINPSESQVPVWLVVLVYLDNPWLLAGREKLIDPSGVPGSRGTKFRRRHTGAGASHA
jgi:hypothetical protein